MKKSLHTVLTAAAFAVSMNNAAAMPTDAAEQRHISVVPMLNDYNPSNDQVITTYGPPAFFPWNTTYTTVEDIVTTTTWDPVGVYGPPSWFENETTTTSVEDLLYLTTTPTTTAYGSPSWWKTTTEDIINTTTTVYPSTEYGPMQIFGDVNWDGTTDVFDVIALRKAVIRNEYNYNDDMNGDGELGIADLVSLQNYLLGRYTTWDEMTNPDMPTTTVENIIQTTETPTYTTYGAVTAYRPWQNAPYTNKTTQTTAKEE